MPIYRRVARRTARRTSKRMVANTNQNETKKNTENPSNEFPTVKPTYQDDIVYKEKRNNEIKKELEQKENSVSEKDKIIIKNQVEKELIIKIEKELKKRDYDQKIIDELKFIISEIILK